MIDKDLPEMAELADYILDRVEALCEYHRISYGEITRAAGVHRDAVYNLQTTGRSGYDILSKLHNYVRAEEKKITRAGRKLVIRSQIPAILLSKGGRNV